MSFDNLELEDSTPIKPRLFVFNQRKQNKRSLAQTKVISTISFSNPENLEPYNKLHLALKPKLPSKKLFEEPRFFMSLERRKVRMIDGLKTMTQFQKSLRRQQNLRGKKLKEHHQSCSRRSEGQSRSFQHGGETQRPGWHGSSKTPLLNYNLNYLIRRRKSMTPILERQQARMYQTVRNCSQLN